MGEEESADISEDELDRLAGVKFNGREVSLNRDFEKSPLMSDGVQIKNTIAIAQNLAARKGAQVSYAYIRQALIANGYSIPEPSDASIDYTLYE